MVQRIKDQQRHRLLRTPILRIYTFQSVEAQTAAEQRGFWCGSADVVEDDFDRENNCGWLYQYDWMRQQMAFRLPDYSGEYPVWAHLVRPNLRQTYFFSHPTVLVVADIPRERVLISDYDRWHSCLNHWFCSNTEAEDNELDRRWGRGTPSRAFLSLEMVRSWERIFDLSDVTDPEMRKWRGGNPNMLQACVDRILPSEVVSVRPVTGRLGRNRDRNP